MNKIKLFGVIAVALPILGASGCAAQKPYERDPQYAPVRPMSSPPSLANDGSIYQPGFAMSLFAGGNARQVGDILTVVLTENTNASKSASTKTKKDSSVDMADPTIFGQQATFRGNSVLNNSVAAARDFGGEGNSTQSNRLNGSISVSVVEVLHNGNLLVRGEKVLTLNQGTEFVKFYGMVRPADITSDNSVLSTKVADAQIIYGGEGAIADSNTQGWMSRIYNSKWWPF